MALEIFKLVGSVFVDTDKANESLQKTDKKASSFASTLGTVAKGAGAVALGVAGAVATVGAGVMKVASDVSESADEIDKASIRMGISTESYQELAYAAGQCGVEMSTMEQAAKKLEGTDLSFDDAINQIMELGTAEERSAKAAELFGEKVAYNLSPLIEQSGDDFDALTQRAHELGLVMSEDAVKGGVQFGDLMSDLKQSIGSLATAVGAELFPILISMIDNILEFMPQIQGYMQQIAPILAQVVSAVLPVLFEILDALLPVAVEIIQEIMPLAVDIIMALLPLIQSLIPLIKPISELLMAILVPLVDLLTNLLPPIIDLVTHIINAIMPMLVQTIKFVSKTVSDIMNGVVRSLNPFFTAIISMFEGLATFLSGVFTGDWEKAWSGITQIAKGFVNTILTYIQGTINGVINMINTIVDAAMRLANLIPGVDINTSVAKIPEITIPLLAKGGVIEESGQAIVGEAGAELLTLPKGATVSPLPQTTSITKEDLTDAFVEALERVGLQITINPNMSRFFDSMVEQNLTYKKTHGGLSAI